MRDRSLGGIRLVLPNNPESLLAAIIPCNFHRGAEVNPIMIFRRRNDPSVRSSEDQYRTSRDADAKAARSPEFCAAAYAVRAAASSTSIRAAPSGVTSFGCLEICRSGSSSTGLSCSFTNALLIGRVAAEARQIRQRPLATDQDHRDLRACRCSEGGSAGGRIFCA